MDVGRVLVLTPEVLTWSYKGWRVKKGLSKGAILADKWSVG